MQGLGTDPSQVVIEARQTTADQWRHFNVDTTTLLQIIGVTLYGSTSTTNKGGILMTGTGSRLAVYSTIFDRCGKSDDQGGAIYLGAGRGIIGDGVRFLNNSSPFNGGAVSPCVCYLVNEKVHPPYTTSNPSISSLPKIYLRTAANLTIGDNVVFTGNRGKNGGAVRVICRKGG